MNNVEKLELTNVLVQLEQIDYTSIIRILSPIITYYVTNKAIKGYHLHKDFKPKNISQVVLPPELVQKYSDVNIEKLASQRFGEAVIEFAKTVMSNFSDKDLINFYNNLNELKVKSKNYRFQNLILGESIAGTYNAKKNLICVNIDNYLSTIWHELFHMASSIYKDGIYHSGFRQSSVKSQIADIGNGLNEGYTQLLTERYFGNNRPVLRAYGYGVHLALKLEEIVGQEKMESLYLNANLQGLIDELKKYISEEETMKFLSGTDFLYKHLNDVRLFPSEKEMITESLKNANEFLIKAYIMKMKKQLDDGEIGIDELNKYVYIYVSSLGLCLVAGQHMYKFSSLGDLEEKIRTIFAANDLTMNVDEVKPPLK